MKEQENREFGFWRQLLWPVYPYEAMKVGLLVGLLFFLCMSYSVLRCVKDTLLLTAGGAGAEALPFLKVWGMLPGALIATWILTRLSRRFTRRTLFYQVLGFYIAYFLIFAFVLFPAREWLTCSDLGIYLKDILPVGFKGLISIITHWNISLFYVITELWSSVVLAVLFWGVANELSSIAEARRTYGILNLGSNIAPLCGAFAASLIVQPLITPTVYFDRWGLTLIQVLLLVVIFCIVSLFLFHALCKLFPAVADQVMQSTCQKKRPLSLRTAISVLLKDPYLLSIGLIVIGYNITINLTDLVWKDHLQRTLVDPSLILEHMNLITMGIGVFATFGGLAFSPLIRRLGWTKVALITPFVMTALGIAFFSLRLGYFSPEQTFFGFAPALIALFCGSLQNCLCKACKYSLFDATKEMAFLPLDTNTRGVAKSAIDGLGSSVGKSGASLTSQGLILLWGGLAAATPWVALIVFIVLGSWIFATVRLGKTVEARHREEEPSFK